LKSVDNHLDSGPNKEEPTPLSISKSKWAGGNAAAWYLRYVRGDGLHQVVSQGSAQRCRSTILMPSIQVLEIPREKFLGNGL
jgi:hypothetical protein